MSVPGQNLQKTSAENSAAVEWEIIKEKEKTVLFKSRPLSIVEERLPTQKERRNVKEVIGPLCEAGTRCR